VISELKHGCCAKLSPRCSITCADTENDLCELKVKRWRQKVNSREEWGSVVKVAGS
jgi:hypothetical protein